MTRASRSAASAHRTTGFSLMELLVAVAVFALASALAWAGIAAVARTREHLAAEQDAFAAVARSVELLSRDLGQAVVRPVRDANGSMLPALVGDGTRIELTRTGYVGAPATAQSDLERVAWQLDGHALMRLRWPVLDRAPGSTPAPRVLDEGVTRMALRYLDHGGRWQARWPAPRDVDAAPLPRAVEFRLEFETVGEIRRVIELVASQPVQPERQGVLP